MLKKIKEHQYKIEYVLIIILDLIINSNISFFITVSYIGYIILKYTEEQTAFLVKLSILIILLVESIKVISNIETQINIIDKWLIIYTVIYLGKNIKINFNKQK